VARLIADLNGEGGFKNKGDQYAQVSFWIF
jgi:hypothetical protein